MVTSRRVRCASASTAATGRCARACHPPDFVAMGWPLFASAPVRMACPRDTPGHLLVWHLLPVVRGVVASVLVGALCLADRRRRRRDRPR